MVKFVEKKEIIMLKEKGKSNREVSRQTGHDRETVSKYWDEYGRQLKRLEEPGADAKSIQESLLADPKYNGGKRVERGRRKYTEEVEEKLKKILSEEERKNRLTDWRGLHMNYVHIRHTFGEKHKQKLTNKQIHQKLLNEGCDISGITINIALAALRKRKKEVFIRQEYELGDRLEYDFGEVYLDCGEGVKTYHMAVLSSPGGSFRWL